MKNRKFSLLILVMFGMLYGSYYYSYQKTQTIKDQEVTINQLEKSHFVYLHQTTKLDFDSLYALPTCILFHIRIQADLLCRNRQQIMSFLETITRFILVILNVFYRYIIRLIFSCLI